MVPVGGSVVASSNAEFVREVAQIYPGEVSCRTALIVLSFMLLLACNFLDLFCVLHRSRVRNTVFGCVYHFALPGTKGLQTSLYSEKSMFIN